MSVVVGPRLRMTLFYAPGDEVLETSVYFGHTDGITPPPINGGNLNELIGIATSYATEWKAVMPTAVGVLGVRIDCPDDPSIGWWQENTFGAGGSSGELIPLTNILRVVFKAARNPVPAPPARPTYLGGMKLSGSVKTTQDNGRWVQSYIDALTDGPIQFLKDGITLDGETYVLAAGGPGNNFSVDTVFVNPVVSRSIKRRGNRSQGQRDVVAP